MLLHLWGSACMWQRQKSRWRESFLKRANLHLYTRWQCWSHYSPLTNTDTALLWSQILRADSGPSLCLVISWCKMTALMKLVSNSASIGSLDVRLYLSSLGHKLHHPVFPALMRTASKIHLTDEFISAPQDINTDMGQRLMWTFMTLCVCVCVCVCVCRTLGPGSRASWIHLSAAAPPADLWALQWRSLAAPHSAGERREERAGQTKGERGESESENGLF